MIEKYFAESDVKVASIRDNNTSLTFVCAHRTWDEPRLLTLSDLGIAKVFNLNLKLYSRTDFIAEVQKLFSMDTQYVYSIPEWEFPIPEEWAAKVASFIRSAKESRLFNSIDASYIKSIEPPLYAYYLLTSIVSDYDFCPTDLLNLRNNPSLLFTQKVLYVRRKI